MSKRKPRRTGMRRSHLKRFSGAYINAGKTANSAYIKESADRAKSLSRNKEDIKALEYFEKNLTHANRDKYTQGSKVATESADDVVFNILKGMNLWQSDFWQGFDHVHRKNLIMTDDRSLFLFISRSRFFFVAEKRGRDWNNLPIGSVRIKRSRVYPTLEIAMMALEAHKIGWVDKKTVANMPSIILDSSPIK